MIHFRVLATLAALSVMILGTVRASVAQPGDPSTIPDMVRQAIAPAVAPRVPVALVSGYTVDPDGTILLELHAAAPVGAAEEGDLLALGATIELSTASLAGPPGLGVIVARIGAGEVAAAAALPWVVAVRPVERNPPDVGPNLSEGVDLHDADVAQASGIDGTGVTVGVISDGVASLAAAQAAGELPAGVNVLNALAGCVVVNPGNCDEGTAMLEIVHDMAPGAGLAFHATGAGTMGHITAQNALVAAGVHVLTEDIPFDAEPAFQQGAVAANGETIAAAGVSVHSSAGNLGRTHAARVAAVPVAPTDLVGFAGCGAFGAGSSVVDIDPGAGTSFDASIPAGGRASFTLQWSEPRAIFPTAGAGGFTDLNLHLMDAAGTTCFLNSANAQGGGAGDTIEQINAVNMGAMAVPVKIVVSHAGSTGAVRTPIIDLRWRGAGAIDAPTREGSLNPDSNYTGLATSSAAANAGPLGGSTARAFAPLEPFSSGGPVHLLLSTVCPGGVYPCPAGGVAGAPGTTAGAPSWTAADGVSVSGAGGFGRPNPVCPAAAQGDCLFFGTSAAAPHAAGCDALVRQAGATTVAAVNAVLSGTATDRGPAGFDNAWGAGILNCPAAAIAGGFSHFECHEARRKPRFARVEGVGLEDQFGAAMVDVRQRKRLCNPADKNDEDPTALTDPDHLMAYEIRRRGPRFTRVVDVGVLNQFGTVLLEVVRPERLLVPTAKSLIGPPGPLQNPIDHFQCYRVRRVRTREDGLKVVDQFGTLRVDLKRPLRLCAPVGKNGAGIADEATHLLCYKAKATPRRGQFADDIFVENQLESATIQVSGPRELCVPSAKVRCCGPVDACIDADGTATAGHGIPSAVDVPLGAALTAFPAVPNNAGLGMFDNDNNQAWTFGAAGDDLHVGGPAFCPLGVADGDHDLGLDCPVLDLNGSLANGQPVSCELDTGALCMAPLPSPIKFHDANGNGSWDDGEDIVLDRNGNGICD
jgi:hypothetical protein